MIERKGQGLYNRLWNRRESFLDGEDTIEKINHTIAQKLKNLSDKDFDEIMDNIMKENQRES